MESHEILRRAMSKLGVKAVASGLGLSTSLVYKWCEPFSEESGDEQSGARNPLDRALEIVRITGDPAIVAWLCERSGGFFVPNPQEAVSKKQIDADALKNTQTMLSEFSDVLDKVCSALADGEGIDRSEAREIRREWEELKAIGEAFVTACERGRFAK